MPQVIEADLQDKGCTYAIIVSRFNDFITRKLLDGALDTLRLHGVATESRVTVVWVPGCFEMPITARRLAKSYDAIIALGCVIRGGTPHFEYVAGECTRGLGSVALKTGVPVAFGVLTTDNIDQAMERSGTEMGNKGREAALAALEMVGLFQVLGG